MSFINPSSQPRGGAQKGGARRHEANKIYANPLPLLFIEPPPSRVRSILGLLGLSLTQVENPHCEGVFDPTTRSVWVSNHEHSMVLWRRGFFGKGDLSRSEPSWLARQINIRKNGGKRVYIHVYVFSVSCWPWFLLKPFRINLGRDHSETQSRA